MGNVFEDTWDSATDQIDEWGGKIEDGVANTLGNRDWWDKWAPYAALGGLTNMQTLGVSLPVLGYYYKRWRDAKNQADQERADDARRREIMRQALIDSSIQRLRAEYGIDPGEGGDEDLKKIALDAKGRIDEYTGRFAADYSDAANAQVQDLYQTAARTSRQQMARQGLVGGSVDSQTARDNISNLVAERQKVVQQTKAQTAAAKSALDAQRQTLEGQALNGLDPSWAQLPTSQSSSILDAMSENAMSGIGDSLRVGAQSLDSWTDSVAAKRSRQDGSSAVNGTITK